MRGSTAFGSDRESASCTRGRAPECVFTLEVPARSELRVALETSNFDGALAIYTDGDDPRELACIDDTPTGDARHARLERSLAPGRYRLAVDGASGETGEFELFAELEPLPSVRDVCARAPELTPGAFVRDATRGGLNLFSATCAGGAEGPDHVRALRLDRPARVRIRQEAEYDGALYLRSACEDASSELVCSDDFGASASSLITARLGAGTYYVFSDSYAREQSGEYVLSLERADEPASRPPERVCAEAERAPRLASGSHELDTLRGSDALAGSCGGDHAPEVVLPLRVDAPSTLVAVLEDAELNAVVYVRRACAAPSTELACYVAPRVDRSPDESASSPPALSVALERGSYVLVVDGYEPTDLGAATLRVLLTPRAR